MEAFVVSTMAFIPTSSVSFIGISLYCIFISDVFWHLSEESVLSAWIGGSLQSVCAVLLAGCCSVSACGRCGLCCVAVCWLLLFVFACGRCGLCAGGLSPLYVVYYVYIYLFNGELWERSRISHLVVKKKTKTNAH